MLNNSNNTPLKLFVEDDLLWLLSELDNGSDSSQRIIASIITRNNYANYYKKIFTEENMPLILKNLWVNFWEKNRNGDRFYNNLFYLYELLLFVKDGKIKLYTTAEVSDKINKYYPELSTFIANYVTILSVNKKNLWVQRTCITYLKEKYKQDNIIDCQQSQNGVLTINYDLLNPVAISGAYGLDFLSTHTLRYLNSFVAVQQENRRTGFVFPSSIIDTKGDRINMPPSIISAKEVYHHFNLDGKNSFGKPITYPKKHNITHTNMDDDGKFVKNYGPDVRELIADIKEMAKV